MPMVSGILATDGVGWIKFFKGTPKLTCRVSNKYDRNWWYADDRMNTGPIYWPPILWKATYDLKPPAPGKCFEVELEL